MRPSRAAVLVSLLVILTTAACGGGQGTPLGTATDMPGTTADARATPTIGATASAPVDTAAPPSETVTELPVATIVTSTGSIQGTLGSYALDGRGADGPWLPYSTLPSVTVATNGTLAVRFHDGSAIGDWTASIATASDTGGSTTVGVQGTGPSNDRSTISLGPLPAGSWVLQVRLFREDGRGDGATYWAVSAR